MEAGQTVKDSAAYLREEKNHVVGACTEPVGYERVGRHTFKTANFGDASEKRMHWSMAVQLCPLWHLFELNWSVVTDVWSIPHVARAAEWTENIQGPYFVPGGILCCQKIRAAPIGCSARQGPRFTLRISHSSSHVTCDNVRDLCIEGTAWSSIIHTWVDDSGEAPSQLSRFWWEIKNKRQPLRVMRNFSKLFKVHEIKTHQVAI